MLIVKSSVVGSASIRSSVTDSSRSRYGMSSGVWGLLMPARCLLLVEGEEHVLAAHREVAPLGMAHVVLGHEDAAQVGMAGEHDAEHVVDLALLVVRRAEQVHDG